MNTLKIGELVIDNSIFPRSALNYVHVDALKNALLSGAAFPPLIVERSTKRIVDGTHRYNAYKVIYGDQHDVEVEFRDFTDDNELWLAAVEANTAHGLGYGVYDRRKILVEAERRGIKRELIADVLKMPLEKVERRLVTSTAFVKTPAGQERVALRTPMKPLAGRVLTRRQEEANKKSAMTAEYHCRMLMELLRGGLLSWCSRKTKTTVVLLHKELAKQV